jgi:hypothetical protein
VDRNPLAVDLARLSLWLATLARDHEFTFLDHALKSGDSLVGLTRSQIGALTWGDDRQGALYLGYVREKVAHALNARRAIRDAPDDVARAIQEARHRDLETRMHDVHVLGDAVLATFFGSAKDRARKAECEALRAAFEQHADRGWAAARPLAATMAQYQYPIRPFHWEIEFPEVFTTTSQGFDVMVGNPPFVAGSSISGLYSTIYLDWLHFLFAEVKGQADIVTFFFRRAFSLISDGGVLGLLATNTISQGDSRAGGLRYIRKNGGQIYRVRKRIKWTGDAAVTVTSIHIMKSLNPIRLEIDGLPASKITAFLVPGGADDDPVRLAANANLAFMGYYYYGAGFTFDDGVSGAEPVSRMRELLQQDPRNADIIHPMIGGEEMLRSPNIAPDRFVIDFENMTEEEARKYPELLAILEARVKPERATNKRERLRNIWWQFAETRPGLRRHSKGMTAFLMHPFVSKHMAFAFVRGDIYVASPNTVVISNSKGVFASLQSRSHEIWVRFFASSLEDRLRYTISDCLETFPLPPDCAEDPILCHAGDLYYSSREHIMLNRNDGLSKTYNRFHDVAETAPDIASLRTLHHDMDVAVLRAYGWDDLADRAAPEFLTEDTEPDHRYQGRLFWPAPFRDEVLARLLDLNARRAAEEKRLGLAPIGGAPQDSDEDEAA